MLRGKFLIITAVSLAGALPARAEEPTFYRDPNSCIKKVDAREYEIRPVKTVDIGGERIGRYHITPEGQIVVSTQSGVKMFDAESGKLLRTLRPAASKFATPVMPIRGGFVVGAADGLAHFYDNDGMLRRTFQLTGRFEPDAGQARYAQLEDGRVALVTTVHDPDLGRDDYQVTMVGKGSEPKGGFISRMPIKGMGSVDGGSTLSVCSEFPRNDKKGVTDVRRVYTLDGEGKVLSKSEGSQTCDGFARNGVRQDIGYAEEKPLPGLGSTFENNEMIRIWAPNGRKVGEYHHPQDNTSTRPSAVPVGGDRVVVVNAHVDYSGGSYITAFDPDDDQRFSFGSYKVALPKLKLSERLDNNRPPETFLTKGGRRLVSVYSQDHRKVIVFEVVMTRRHFREVEQDCPIQTRPEVAEEPRKDLPVLNAPAAEPGATNGMDANSAHEPTPFVPATDPGSPAAPQEPATPPAPAPESGTGDGPVTSPDQVDGPVTSPSQVDSSSGTAVPPATTP